LLYAYRHGDGESNGCAITGGAFYNPRSTARYEFPSGYTGDYFFADFCGGWIRRYDAAADRAYPFKGRSAERPVDLKAGPDGDLYYLARDDDGSGDGTTGAVKRIRYSGS
jgi:glucose/arabinose dehydrogenase